MKILLTIFVIPLLFPELREAMHSPIIQNPEMQQQAMQQMDGNLFSAIQSLKQQYLKQR